jgi:hypothetical protein
VAPHLLGAIVTDRRIRDLRRLLEIETEPYGASVTIEITNGGHLRHTFRLGDRHVFTISSFSPRCTGSHQKTVVQARRALRALTSVPVSLGVEARAVTHERRHGD